MSRALVVGSEGQDGRILSDRLRAEGCETVGVGRGMEYSDMPTIRAIAREAAAADHRFSAIVLGVVRSPQFQMRVKTDETLVATR